MQTKPLGHDAMELLMLGMAGVDTGSIIEMQEKRGQSQLQNSGRLPIKGTDGDNRSKFETLGFVFGEKADELFVNVTFPDGWNTRPTDHSMWSDIVDANNNIRASMFYKAAFYDMDAFISLTTRYTIDLHSQEYDCKDARVGHIIDNVGVKRIFTAVDPTPGIGESWEANDRVQPLCLAFLEQNYPDYKNALAYWNE